MDCSIINYFINFQLYHDEKIIINYLPKFMRVIINVKDFYFY